MTAVYVHVRRRENNIRRNKMFRDRDNPLDYLADADIARKYRLSRPMILELCGMFQNQLARSLKCPIHSLSHYKYGSPKIICDWELSTG